MKESCISTEFCETVKRRFPDRAQALTDACVRYGRPEPCPCFCDSDDITYDNMHPRLLWRRTKTLGRGGDCCDFCLKIQEDDHEGTH